MPWLSPSIKLIETFLESKRNEPLPPTPPNPSHPPRSPFVLPPPLSISFPLSPSSRVSLDQPSLFPFTPHSLSRSLALSVYAGYTFLLVSLFLYRHVRFKPLFLAPPTSPSPFLSPCPPIAATPTASLMSMLLSRHSVRSATSLNSDSGLFSDRNFTAAGGVEISRRGKNAAIRATVRCRG